MARPENVRLGELLVQQKLLTQEQLMAALEEQKKTGRRFGRVIVEKGIVSEEQISQALARQLRAPFINLKTFTVDAKLINLLSETQARRFRAIVLSDSGAAVTVGMADPTDLSAFDELARILKREIELAVVTETMLLQTVDRLYRRTQEITGLAKELREELGDTTLDFGTGATPGGEEAPVARLLQSLFEDAVQVRASDIHIEPQETRLVIRFRIDGVLHIQTEADLRIASALVLRLKLTAGLDISEKRLPQDGRFNVSVRGNAVDVRISSMPTQYGESVVMRLLIQSGASVGLDKIGLPPRMLEQFRRIIRRPSGMVLVTGPTGSGKTTTLYSVLAELNSPEKKIITVEDPVEYRLPGINQVQVQEKIELTFARVLRAALRQDPDIILVGEMRDHGTVETGLRAAMTGHLVLSTLHTNDAASTPMRLLDMGAPRYMVAMSLQVVVAQRLLRVVCETCTAPHALSAFEREWLKSELGERVAEFRFMRGAGCTQCNGAGYTGRTGVYEMLEMTQPLIEAANQGEPRDFVRAARQQLAGHTLRRHAVLLAAQGKTTVEEAIRISNQVSD